MSNKLIVWGGGLLLLLIGVRAVAPAVQEWSWKQEMYADRAKSYRDLERRTQQVSVEAIVSRPMGMLLAASTCGDTDLANRAEKAWLAFAKKLQPDRPSDEVSARAAAAVTRARAVDPRLQIALKKDCRKTLELASAAVAQYEK